MEKICRMSWMKDVGWIEEKATDVFQVGWLLGNEHTFAFNSFTYCSIHIYFSIANNNICYIFPLYFFLHYFSWSCIIAVYSLFLYCWMCLISPFFLRIVNTMKAYFVSIASSMLWNISLNSQKRSHSKEC